jgi:hypothetical protein
VDIGGWETDGAAAFLTMVYVAADLVWATEHPVSIVEPVIDQCLSYQ